ncbi:DUF1858 domain-containing protein [Clostridium sp. LBM24168]
MSIIKVNEKTLIKDIISMGPKAVEILKKSGLECIACSASQKESIEEAAKIHKINLDELIKSLNKIPLGEKIKWKIKSKIINSMKSRYSK